MLATRENNKLIVEFMEYPKSSEYWSRYGDSSWGKEDWHDNKNYYYVDGKYSEMYGSNFHINDMRFNVSWDWLMPVIEKIQDKHLENPELDYWSVDEIRLAIPNIQQVHYLVVEFIKNQNN
jgi:hypothetical protein|tara:strand:+ start:300 stop:662 length:363 start_codon:yes stop_codon:yes gene_type:complete